MSRVLAGVSLPALRELARALETGALRAPFTAVGIERHVERGLAGEVADYLARLADVGMTPAHVSLLLHALAAERAAAQEARDRIQLVWSGPEPPGAGTRDTAVVVPELFRTAERSVLLSAFSLDFGAKARAVLQPLALRMAECPSLDVAFYINIQRRHDDARSDADILRAFRHRFERDLWPGDRSPSLYYDPRALELGTDRACLHAKCLVVDERWSLVTSANFTEAAQLRNLEAGVLLDDPATSRALVHQFEGLRDRGVLRSLLPGSGPKPPTHP